MDAFEKIKEVSNLLDEIDDYTEKIPEIMSNYDNKVADLYHKLEDMNLTVPKCYRFCKELKQVLAERREYKINMAVLQSFKNGKQKLIAKNTNRQFLLSDLGKVKKNSTIERKLKAYTEEELNEKIGVWDYVWKYDYNPGMARDNRH